MFKLFALIVISIISQIIETISGFGSTVISVTLGANFYPIEFLVPVLVPLNLFLSAYIVLRYRSYIDKIILFKKILPLMLIGLIIGVTIFNFVQGIVLKQIFGILVLMLSLYELLNILRRKQEIRHLPMATFPSILWLIFSGIIHGIYACGGPFLVYYITRMQFSKQTFRSTLSLLWLILNLILTLIYIKAGNINIETIKLSIILLPTLPMGIILGEWIHHRLNERLFNTFVFVLLLIAGISLLVQ